LGLGRQWARTARGRHARWPALAGSDPLTPTV
jgi:hypothetical protein